MKYIFMILVAFLFTGCGVAMKIEPKNDKTDRSVNYNGNINKINNIVSISSSVEKVDAIDIQGRPGVSWTTTITSDFTNNVSADFLGQYFKYVKIGDKSGYLNFGFRIVEAKMISLGNQPHYKIKYHVTVNKGQRNILDNIYTGDIKAPYMLESKYGFSPIEGTELFAEKALQKGYFNLLEKQLKPDLLKALKENI